MIRVKFNGVECVVKVPKQDLSSILSALKNKLKLKKKPLFLLSNDVILNDRNLLLYINTPLTASNILPSSVNEGSLLPWKSSFVHTLGDFKVLVLSFANSILLQNTCKRIHEYYEGGSLNGPLKGINFDIQVFLDWTRTTAEYTLFEKEMKSLIEADQVEYVIGYIVGDEDTLLHEWTHAVYKFSCDYKSDISDIIARYKGKIDGIFHDLKQWGYKEGVYEDEIQAYLVENLVWKGKFCEKLRIEIVDKFKEACNNYGILNKIPRIK